jgi:hypothetical protein
MSENQTVNVKELTSELANLKKMVESLVKEPKATEHVEETVGGTALLFRELLVKTWG